MSLASAIRDPLDAVDGVGKVVCPPFVSLAAVRDALTWLVDRGGRAEHALRGAWCLYTGEVSSAMLADLCTYVIIGHSERRQHFWETDEVVNRKVRAALEAGLRPILCVGEGLEEREEGYAESVVTSQLRGALRRVDSIAAMAVAYEPIWAIGTGMAATGEAAEAIMVAIRGTLTELYGDAASGETPLLYGGSVTPDNVAEFASQPNINGALVGGASLDAGRFAEIARQVAVG